jgi:hypothetical protein
MLTSRRSVKTFLHGGGKAYWAETAAALGVIEVEHGLEFRKSEDGKIKSTSTSQRIGSTKQDGVDR